MKFCLFLFSCLVLLVFSPSIWAEDIYFSQSGGGDGTSCVSSFSASNFNSSSYWGVGAGKISTGDTAHLCGTLTTSLTSQGSGSNGSPITIVFEAGAKISEAVCPSSGCLNIANQSYLIVDGGTACGWISASLVNCNGTVEATASGSAFGNGTTSGTGIYATACAFCEIKNLNVSNIYQHTSASDSPAGDFRGISNLGIPTTNATYSVHNCIIHDVSSGIVYVPGSSSDSGPTIYNNYVYNINSSVDISNNNGGTLNAASVHNNHFGTTANWDATGCPQHHNTLHAFAYTTTNNNIDYYDNFIDGNWGSCSTGGLFIEGNGSVNNNIRVFNNLWIETYTVGVPHVGIYAGGFSKFYNNTIIGNASGDVCLSITGLAGGSQYVENNILSNCSTTVSTSSVSEFSVWDYNIYGVASGQTWTDQSIPAWYSTLATWKAHCSCDAHSASGSTPNYVGVNPNGTLALGSPAIGAGLNLTGLGITVLNSDLAGTARPAVAAWDDGSLQYGTTGAPFAHLDVSAIAFGNVPVSSTSVVTLTNTGDATLNITSIVAPAGFSRTTTCGATLAAAANCIVTVNMANVGSWSGNLVFTTDAASSPDNVALSGIGFINEAPALNLIL